MIIRNKGTHYEIEMFHIVNISKDHPEPAFNEYLKKLAEEFVSEINTIRFAIKTNIPYVPVTSSHNVVEDIVT